MRFYYDLEFGDTASVVSLVSVGVVAEDGREYYAVSSEFDPLAVHPTQPLDQARLALTPHTREGTRPCH